VRRITEASGSQFDPGVVDIFLDIPIDVWKNIRNRIDDSGSEYLKQLVHQINGHNAERGNGRRMHA
jgi:hypothetical protein